ncbi:hypothetical protein K3722_07435 [Leisingera caerulea]|uniref:Uncharacterized protein n=1 Tax=Leisingera caerulea TaxID=506591 RepID=A0ABY5X050_LEICA|nr:hypothetical protein [Leisingera caerulea]UWQ59953.1 hypothetical protein K3722_07435 [Leisingera caerulea]
MCNDQTESKRARVRRLVIQPLQDLGFRFPKGTKEDRQRAMLDRLADSIAYMSDKGLIALQQSLQTKGEGSAKCFWPCRATVMGWAEALEHRPLDELPELLGWFRSRAGAEAMRDGVLLAEYLFWRDNKRPPAKGPEKDRVRRQAAEFNSEYQKIMERRARGFPDIHDQGEFVRWYERTLKKCEAWVMEGKAARKEAGLKEGMQV